MDNRTTTGNYKWNSFSSIIRTIKVYGLLEVHPAAQSINSAAQKSTKMKIKQNFNLFTWL